MQHLAQTTFLPVSYSRHRGARCGRLLSLMALALLCVSVLRGQTTADDLVDGFVQVSVSTVSKQIVEVKADQSEHIFVPFGPFLDILACRAKVSDDMTTYTGYLMDDVSFSVIPGRNITLVNGREEAYDSAWTVVIDGELYLNDSLLARILGTGVSYNPEIPELVVEGDDRLPVIALRNMRQQWGTATMRRSEQTSALSLGGDFGRSLIGFPTLRWMNQTNAASYQGAQASGASTTMITGSLPFLWGQLTLGASTAAAFGSGGGAPTASFDQWSWGISMPSSPIVSGVNINSYGKRGVGVQLSNTDGLNTDVEAKVVPLTGSTEPGWIVEIYRDGRLYTVTRADSVTGEYSALVRIRYGAEIYEITMIGPHGEKEHEERRIGSNTIRVRPGNIEYQLGLSVDTLLSATTPTAGVLNVGVGVMRWISLSAQVNSYLPSMSYLWRKDTVIDWRTLIHPIYGAQVWLGGMSMLNLSYMQNERLASGNFTTTIGPLPVGIGVSNISAAGPRPFARGLMHASTGYSYNFGRTQIGLVAGGLAQHKFAQVNSTAYVITRIGALSASTTYAFKGPDLGLVVDSTDGAQPPIPFYGFVMSDATMSTTLFGKLQLGLNAAYDHGLKKLANLSLLTRYNITEDLDVSASYRVSNLDFSKGAVLAGVNLDLGFMNASSGVGVGATGWNGVLRLDGAVAASRDGIIFGDGSLVNTGNVILRAFNDRNGNGEQDDGEETLTNAMGEARTAASDVPTTANEEGVLESVPTNIDLLIDVDQWSHADKDLYPALRNVSVFVVSGETRVIDIPFRIGYTVSGSCAIERPTRTGEIIRTTSGLSALRVWLTDTTGTVYDGEIFDDGSITVFGIPAGQYRIELDPAQLEYRRLSPLFEEEEVTVTPDSLELKPFILVPAERPTSSPNANEN